YSLQKPNAVAQQLTSFDHQFFAVGVRLTGNDKPDGQTGMSRQKVGELPNQMIDALVKLPNRRSAEYHDPLIGDGELCSQSFLGAGAKNVSIKKVRDDRPRRPPGTLGRELVALNLCEVL